MEKSSKESRIMQVKNLLSKMPAGRGGSYKRMVMYELADKYGIVMTESQLSTFLNSGYSSVAIEIIQALDTVVNRMIADEEAFQNKVQELQTA